MVIILWVSGLRHKTNGQDLPGFFHNGGRCYAVAMMDGPGWSFWYHDGVIFPRGRYQV